MSKRETTLLGECQVIDASGQENVAVYLQNKERTRIADVRFMGDKTVMEILPGYDNWCRQIMRCAKLMASPTNEEAP